VKMADTDVFFRKRQCMSPCVTLYVFVNGHNSKCLTCTGQLTETTSDFRCADVHQEKVCETCGGTSSKDKSTRKSSQPFNVSLKTYAKGNKMKKTKDLI